MKLTKKTTKRKPTPTLAEMQTVIETEGHPGTESYEPFMDNEIRVRYDVRYESDLADDFKHEIGTTVDTPYSMTLMEIKLDRMQQDTNRKFKVVYWIEWVALLLAAGTLMYTTFKGVGLI